LISPLTRSIGLSGAPQLPSRTDNFCGAGYHMTADGCAPL